MPEHPSPKLYPHPYKNGDTGSKRRSDGMPSHAIIAGSADTPPAPPADLTTPPLHHPASHAWAELLCTSNYTFLTGASHPDELIYRAAELGYRAIAVTDLNSMAGLVRAHAAAARCGIAFIPGTRIQPVVQTGRTNVPANWSLALLPTSLPGYSALCNLLTLGKRRAPKGHCHLSVHDIVAALTEPRGSDIQTIFIPPHWSPDQPPDEDFLQLLTDLNTRLHARPGTLGDPDRQRLFLAVSCRFDGNDEPRHSQLRAVSEHVGIPLVAAGDALYHQPQRRALADVLTCIRLGTTLAEAGLALSPNSQRHLHTPEELHRQFAHLPGAVASTVRVAERCRGFSLDQIRYQYPSEVVPAGTTPMSHLTDLAWRGAIERYAHRTSPAALPPPPSASPSQLEADVLRVVPPKVIAQIRHELVLIGELQFAHYFLTVYDLVAFARSRGILCQGRGAAANSAVCYCLGITAVDPDRVSVLFERFVSKERSEPPDIDIDFEHERREEVIQYLYTKYGRHRAALTAEVITYRGRSAVREVGKALGLSADIVHAMAKNLDWWEPGVPQHNRLRELGLSPGDPTIQRLLVLVEQILGFPRHLSQHVGGFIITQDNLCDLVPIENAAMADRTVVQWDKDDIEVLGMLKIDVLGLGMLTCISRCLAMISSQIANSQPAPPPPKRASSPSSSFDNLTISQFDHLSPAFHTIPPDDPAVYDMACRADTVGVFQIESRAQMSMLPRLKPRCYYDLVIQVAIVRPGPIQGDMVHPYLRRRDGIEPVSYPSEKVREILARTLGVPLFQEQAMSMAIHCAGFTPGEADQLRRAIAAWKTKQKLIYHFGRKIITGMVARGYDHEFAQRVFNQIKGFSEYGFPESHAASFAHIVYASAWLKCHYPAHFAAALINSQPMGFYAPAQIIRDAQNHGVSILPIDVNHSRWDCTIEPSRSPVPPAAPASSSCSAFPRDSRLVARDSPLRLGLRLISGLNQAEAHTLQDIVARCGPFRDIATLWRASGISTATLRKLAHADAFTSMRLTRQQAIYAISALSDEALPLFDLARADTSRSPAPDLSASTDRLPAVPPEMQTLHDYAATGLSLKAHPVSFLRPQLRHRRFAVCSDLHDPARFPQNSTIRIAGIPLVRQRPHTANGVMFITIEDETSHANLILWPDIYQRHRAAARHGTLLLVTGTVQRQGQVIHVIVKSVKAGDAELRTVTPPSRDFR